MKVDDRARRYLIGRSPPDAEHPTFRETHVEHRIADTQRLRRRRRAQSSWATSLHRRMTRGRSEKRMVGPRRSSGRIGRIGSTNHDGEDPDGMVGIGFRRSRG